MAKDEDYQLLGLNPDASVKEVKRAFKKLALKYHPDRYKGEDANERFRKLTQAYNNIMMKEFVEDLEEIKRTGSKKIRRYRIEVDWDSCVGSVSCTVIAPDTFKLDERKWKVFSTKAPLEVNSDTRDTFENILLAAQSCPFKAIFLYDEETGEQIYP